MQIFCGEPIRSVSVKKLRIGSDFLGLQSVRLRHSLPSLPSLPVRLPNEPRPGVVGREEPSHRFESRSSSASLQSAFDSDSKLAGLHLLRLRKESLTSPLRKVLILLPDSRLGTRSKTQQGLRKSERFEIIRIAHSPKTSSVCLHAE